ncbi:MHYT domain-containing protein [Rhodococcus zopfii]|uniref:signaling protein n=1 Tax=Rhodococcus zopfii TaxID=43772 RepID=UPI0011115183|nr:signaling protein [Rhodococcus zopfii]
MDADVQLFSMGSWVVALAFATSSIGLLVGLVSARKARFAATERQGLYWLLLAAATAGGVGIWLALLLAVAGFGVADSVVRHDLVTIAFSLAVSLVSSFVAMVVAISRDRHSPGRLFVGGVLFGAGICVVFLSLIWSVRLQGTSSFDTLFVLATAAVSLVVAFSFLWLVEVADRPLLRICGSVVTGAAVLGVYFLGMASVDVTPDTTMAMPEGAELFSVLFAVFVVGMVVITVPIVLVLMDPDRVAAQLEREADQWVADGADKDGAPIG